MAMIIDQKHTVAAPKRAVMDLMLDEEILKASIPRCKEVRKVSPTMMWAMAEIGFQKWNFVLDSTLTILPSQTGFDISGDVRTPSAKLGRIVATVSLTEQDGKTVIASRTTVTPARKRGAAVEKIGVTVAKGVTDAFFTRFAKAVAGRSAA